MPMRSPDDISVPFGTAPEPGSQEGGKMDPVHIDDAVVIYDYDSEWPRLFEEERDRLEPVISAFAVSTEHVGSTAVSGLCSKPIVDLLVTVKCLEPPDRYSAVLAPFGYVLRVDPANTERHAFGKRDALGRRTMPGYNLHVVQHGDAEYRCFVGFRDYLRTHPDAMREYGELKRRLAREYGADRDGYTNAKSAFIVSIEPNCR
jgi:GrpB-like predicted nucleotidyltransferase (UPF0157 family)